MVNRLGSLICLLLAFTARAQITPPGLPPDERVDVTGDGFPDLVITGNSKHWEEQEWGKGGRHERWLAPLPGVAFLFRATPNSTDYYRVEEGGSLSTEEVEAGLRFLQLRWTRPEDDVRIVLLYKAFGFRVVDTTSWYGSDLFEEGTLVIRSTTGKQATLTAFTIDLDVIADKVGFSLKSSIPVDARFGEFTPIRKPFTREDSLHASLFDRPLIPEDIVPAGIPPDERIDLVTNDTMDVVLTGHIVYKDSSRIGGWYRRGVGALPGTAFLMERQADGSYDWFRLKYGEALTPLRLEMGLHSGSLRWADPTKERVFVLALEQAFGLPASEVDAEGWYPRGNFSNDDLVYRSNEYGRPMLGCFEISTTRGGELSINEQARVYVGTTLQAR